MIQIARLEGFEPTTPGSETRSVVCWDMFSNTKWCFLVGAKIAFCIWGGGGCFGVPRNLLAKCLQMTLASLKWLDEMVGKDLPGSGGYLRHHHCRKLKSRDNLSTQLFVPERVCLVFEEPTKAFVR